jgi:hypothetical protein
VQIAHGTGLFFVHHQFTSASVKKHGLSNISSGKEKQFSEIVYMPRLFIFPKKL